MMKIFTLAAAVAVVSLGTTQAQTIFLEGFDDVSSLSSNGWTLSNQSNPVGTDAWSQASGTLGEIAYSGDTLSYAQSSFEATDPQGVGTISDWMVTPTINLNDGDMVRLFAISFNSATFPDRVEVRLSPNGGTDLGSTAMDVGDFTTLLFSINPMLDTVSFPSVATGDTWTEFSGMVTGLGGATNVRIGVRYFVTDAGGQGTNSSTVGIDDLEVYSGFSSVGIDENATQEVVIFPNPTMGELTVNAADNASRLVNVFDAAGKLVNTAAMNGTVTMNLADLNAGSYIVEVTNTLTGAVIREKVQKF